MSNKINIGFVSLGCSKNLVDTEMMMGYVKEAGLNIVADPSLADIIIVNTCGFIEDAKQEAINTILEMAEYKKQRCKFLVATGCLVERYKEELIEEIKEVDLFVKFSEYDEFTKKLDELISKLNKDYKKNVNKELDLDFNNRVVSTGSNYAYVRIADGCDNFCSFCAIPYIRGRFKSRKIEDILEEVKILADKGYKEIILVAQDTTKYGTDIYGKPELAKLIREISKIEKVSWIRFLYSYPETITDELIEEVKTNAKVAKYFDIPMQHISDNILKKMNRKSNKKSIEDLIVKLRKEIKDVVIRTTLMVGFPGETEEDYNELIDFIKWAKFDKLGGFAFSKEENTAAALMEETVDEIEKERRLSNMLEIQEKISKENLKKYISKDIDVIVEQLDVVYDNQRFIVGRTINDVPEIDGYILLEEDERILSTVRVGDIIKAEVTDALDYDLIGRIKFE